MLILIKAVSYHLCVLINGPDLHLELVDLAVVGVVGDRQVVHSERPEGGVELRTQVVPHARYVE